MNRSYLFWVFLLLVSPYFVGAQTLTPQNLIATNDTSFCPPATFQLLSNVQGCSYSIESFPYSPESIGGTMVTLFDDQVSSALPIGFSFDYFCNSYTQFYICSNGWMGFTAGQTQTWVVQQIPSVAFNVPRNVVMAPWRDWNPSVAGGPYISYQTVGTAPNRKLIVTWDAIPMFLCSTTYGTFQVVLSETSNIIENHLTNVPTCLNWGGGDGTQGLHNLNGTVGLVVNGRNDNQFTTTNESWRFLPPTVQWIYQNDTTEGSFLDIEPNGVYPLDCEYVYAILDSGNGGIAIDSVLVSRTCDVPLMSSIDVLCFGDSTGIAMFEDTSFYAQSQFLWNVYWTDVNGDTIRFTQSYNNMDSVTNVPIGTYTVTYFDEDGCNLQTGSVTVTEPTALVPSITNPTAVSCPGTNNCDASAQGNGFGGVGPYFYAWSTGELTQTATMLCPGFNFLTVSDANGCDTVTSVDILVPDPIVTTASKDTTICISNPAALVAASTGGTPPYNYVWTLDTLGGDTVSFSQAEIFFPVTDQRYYVTTTDANNCPGDTAGVLVNVRPKLGGIVTRAKDTICPYDTIDLNVVGTGGDSLYTFSWSTGTIGDETMVSNDLSQWFYVTVADQCGTPTYEDSIFVQVGGYPSIAADLRAEDDSICVGENVYIIAQGSGGFRGPDEYVYNWNRVTWGDNAYQFSSPKKTTTYIVTITDLCLSPAASDTITVHVGAPVLPIVKSTPENACSDAEVTFSLLNFNENHDYDWSFGDGAFAFNAQSDSLAHKYNRTGCYDVRIQTTTDYGCVSERIFPCIVEVLESPTADFVNTPVFPTTLDPLVEFYDKSQGADRIEWAIDGSSISTEDYFTKEFIDTGMYQVRLIATAPSGCKDSIVRVIRNRLEQTLYLPTSFSPNGDGLNDVFGVFGEDIGQEGYELVIYDRWGTEMFLSNNPFYGWDGRVQKGGLATIGTYPYVLKYIDQYNEKKVVSGQVVIIRSESKNSTNN